MAKKTHMEDPKEWNFKRARNDDEHARKCTDGYTKPKTSSRPYWLEIHHVLCVHACSDATFPEDITEVDLAFFHACFAITDWNINESHNNIGLPRKWAYVLDEANATGWDGLPCHQVDHDLYLQAVESHVREKIWMKLLEAQEAETCEEVKGQNIAQKFLDGSKLYKGILTTRGKLYGGTYACLQYCLRGIMPPALSKTPEKWYVPFSMAPEEGDARPRIPPRLDEKDKKLKRAGLLNMVD